MGRSCRHNLEPRIHPRHHHRGAPDGASIGADVIHWQDPRVALRRRTNRQASQRALGISARFWTGLEARFRKHEARQAAERQLQAEASWADDFPLKDLIRHGLIRRSPTKAATLAELLSFFQISSADAFNRQWLAPAAAFRSSPAFMASPKAVAAWLRWGEIEASKIVDVPSFDSRRFRQTLGEIRLMTRRGPFMQILNRVKAMCADAGVVVVLTPEFGGTYLRGATPWLRGRPVIQLSLRHKSDDHFWFAFFHEAGHILNSPRQREFVDPADIEAPVDSDADEEAANQFARDSLLTPHEYKSFVAAGDLSAGAVRDFAQAQQVAPGIVVGRLQRWQIAAITPQRPQEVDSVASR